MGVFFSRTWTNCQKLNLGREGLSPRERKRNDSWVVLSMRVDKYLWAIRAFKTRSLATAHCKEGKVQVNAKPAKPAQDLRSGDRIEVRKGAINFAFEVLEFPKSRVGAGLVEQHVRDVTPQSEMDKLAEIREAQRDMTRPVGRPTKRDRRDWEKYFRE